MSLIQAKQTVLPGTHTHARHAAVASVICAGLLFTAPELALAQEQASATPSPEKATTTTTTTATSETVVAASTSTGLPSQADATVETKTGLTEQQKDEAVANGYKVTNTKTGETKYFNSEADAKAYAGTDGSYQKEELKGLSAEEASKLDESWKVTGAKAGETRYFATEAEARAYAGTNGTVEHEVKGSLTKQEADALDSSWKVTKSDGETKYFADETAAKKFAGSDGKVEAETRTGLNEQQKDEAVANGYKVTNVTTGETRHFSTEAEAQDYAAKNGGTVAKEERSSLSAEDASKLDESWKVTKSYGQPQYFATKAEAKAYAGTDGTVEHEVKGNLTKEQADALDSSWKVTTTNGETKYFGTEAEAKAFAGADGTVTPEAGNNGLTEQEKDKAVRDGWKVVNQHTGETRYFNNEEEARAFAGTDGKVERETKSDLSDAEASKLAGTWQVTTDGYLINGKKDPTLTPEQQAILARATSATYSITRVRVGSTISYIVKDADGNTVTDQELANLIVSKTTFDSDDPTVQKDRYYLKDGDKKIYVNTAEPITLSRDVDGTYYVIDADGAKQTVSNAFVQGLAGNATYSITGYYVNSDGSLRHGVNGEVLQKTMKFARNAKITVFRDGDDFYIADTDGTFLKLFPSDVKNVKAEATPADARTKMLNTDGSQASLKIRNDLVNWLKELSITSDFVLYADTVDEGLHIDGNICVNELDGSNHSIENLYASGRGVVSGLDQYSIVLNDDNDAITFQVLDSSIVAGTNIKAQNINNGFNKFGGSASATDVEHHKATDPDFSKAPMAIKQAINNAIAEAEADPAFQVKNSTVKSHLADLIYTICQKEQITDPTAVGIYAKTILSQVQVGRTLDDIASTSQQLIDDAVAQAATKAGKGTADYLSTFTTGKAQCEELLNTLNAGNADVHSVFVVNLSSADLNTDSHNGVIGDNGLVEQIMHANRNIGATIIFNVITPQGTTELNFDKNHVDNSYEEATGYYFWNFGNYSGHIQNDWTNEGTVVAGNASFTKGNGSRDGSVVARKVKQRSEIHQAKKRSFTGDETSSYSIAPDAGYTVTPEKEIVTTTDPTFTVKHLNSAVRYKSTEELYDVVRYKATTGTSYAAERFAGTKAQYAAERYRATAPATYDVARYKATNATYHAERFAGTNTEYGAERYKATNKLYDVEKTTVTFHNDHDAPKPKHFSHESTTPKHTAAKHEAPQQAAPQQAARHTTASVSAVPKTGDTTNGTVPAALATLGLGVVGVGEALRRKLAHKA